jgi:hypothetical protein
MSQERCSCPCHRGERGFFHCFLDCCDRPNEEGLLTRDEFRESVFARDKDKCVICGEPAKDAHHILERRLWADGGYYVSNGVSLCEQHHLEAEQTTLSCEQLRAAAGIAMPILPEHLYADQPYDKWGNPVLANGTRLRGELFDDESVQKILSQGNVLGLFTKYVRYPRTFHLPWSPGLTSDDRTMPDTSAFEGKLVVVTVKMDGENTTLYNDYCHARSLEYEAHPSRNLVKALHGRVAHDIPDGWRVNVENLFAKHAIHYQNLSDFALLFGIWDERNYILSWEETKEYSALLGLTLCPVLYQGPWDESAIRGLLDPYKTRDCDEHGNPIYRYNGDEMEGYVVRDAGRFHYKDFRRLVGKYVRKGHVPEHCGHWKRRPVTSNKIAARMIAHVEASICCRVCAVAAQARSCSRWYDRLDTSHLAAVSESSVNPRIAGLAP